MKKRPNQTIRKETRGGALLKKKNNGEEMEPKERGGGERHEMLPENCLGTGAPTFVQGGGKGGLKVVGTLEHRKTAVGR